MTWNIKDTLGPSGRAPTGGTGMPPPQGPTWDDTAPLPTVAAAMAWEAGDTAFTVPLLDDEALHSEGFLSDRDVAWWRQIMTRGVPSL